ncbi:MAG: hypothetical protein QM778_34970 [Myxococcales bacterium]
MKKYRNGAKSFIAACFVLSAAGCGDDASNAEVGGQEQALTAVPQPSRPYTLFESLQVRPLALSPNGKFLFAANTADNRLEMFSVSASGLSPAGSVSVGLEPVAVAARSDSEIWVVNHLSDSVSVVKLEAGNKLRVVRTLHVGDEPRDIVFAGPGKSRAFITTAHRGQNGDDPQLFDSAAGRADVWVYDANNLGIAAGGSRLTKITLFADTPRALAASADGSRVYAAPFFSGNQTTMASKDAVRHVYASSVNPANPNVFLVNGQPTPITGRVVKYKAGPDGQFHWFDDLGTNFDAWVRVQLPDNDVFSIDANALIPYAITNKTFAHLGTTLFNMAVNPVNGKVYVANTEAHNDVRFEGHNPTLPVTSVRGRTVDSRISVLDPGTGGVVHNDLNRHVVNGVGDGSLSRAFPQDLGVTSNGQTLVVVAQGSGKLAVYATSELEAGTAMPTASNQVVLSAGGPAGVVLDERNNRAYVLTRFDNGISTVSLASRSEIAHRRMFSPEPAVVTEGRRFLYDAAFTSENGTQACASCHIGGDNDQLSWDLGNPGGAGNEITKLAANKSVIWTAPPEVILQTRPLAGPIFERAAALKGPMSTQSLRGLDNHGSMHWRGDRNGAIQQNGQPFIDPGTGQPVVSAQPNAGIFDEFRAFESFNVAFPGLVGRNAELSSADMAAFAAFALEISYPPNPIRNLDDSLTLEQEYGRSVYFQTDAQGNELPVDRLHNCNGCHTLDRNGNAGQTDHPGFFGTSGRLSFENLPQIFKVAHFRNAYTKVGMFGSSPDENRTFTTQDLLNPAVTAVRGFGYQPDGAVGSIEHHLTGKVFIRTDFEIEGASPNPGGIPTFYFDADKNPVLPDPGGFVVRRGLAAFLLAYDSNVRPIVGQQITLNLFSAVAAGVRIDLLKARAQAGDCDLIVKGMINGRERGYVFENGKFRPDDSSSPITDLQLRAMVPLATDALTYTCVPPGTGYRVGIDRDADGIADGNE